MQCVTGLFCSVGIDAVRHYGSMNVCHVVCVAWEWKHIACELLWRAKLSGSTNCSEQNKPFISWPSSLKII